MSLHWTEKELAAYRQRTGKRVSPVPSSAMMPIGTEKETAQRKYHNKPTTGTDGDTYQSKHEAKMCEQLRLECLAGMHMGLGKQVTFFLPGGVKYIADFVTLEADGTYTVYDAKSEATRKDKTYRLKKRQMKECLHIPIKEF